MGRYSVGPIGRPVGPNGHDQRDAKLRDDLLISAQAEISVQANLDEIVEKTDQTERERDEQRRQHERCALQSEDQRGDENAEKRHNTAHRRRTLLGLMGIGPLFALHLPKLELPEHRYDDGP